MAAFLLPPFFEGSFGRRPCITVTTEHDSCIGGCCHVVDEEVVVARFAGHEMGKTAGFKEERFAVRQVASHAHIGVSAKGGAEVMESVEEGVVADETVDVTLRMEIGTETEDDFDWLLAISYWLLAFKTTHHFRDPVVGLGDAVGVSKQEIVVFSRFGGESECQLFGGTYTCTVGHKRHMQTFVTRHVVFDDLPCAVFRSVIDHNDFVLGVVLREQCLEVLGEIIAFVMSAEEDGNSRGIYHLIICHLVIWLLAVGFFIFAQLAGGGEEVTEIEIELREERHEQKPEEDVVKYGERG